MDLRPRLSVIVPVYNSRNYLVKCLDSILQQDFDSFELICVNDGSTDDSETILRSYKTKFSNYKIINKTNGGLSSARNAGLDVASGEFVAFIDSDDYINPGMFKELVDLFEDDVDLVMCGTSVEYMSWTNLKRSDDVYFKITHGRNETINSGMFNKMNVCAWNKYFRMELIKKYNIRFPEGLWYEDAAFFWCYMSISRNISCTPNKYYNYIRYKNSIMGSTLSGHSKAIDYLNVVKFVMDFLIKNQQLVRLQDSFFNFLRAHFELSLRYVPFKDYSKVIKLGGDLLLSFNNSAKANELPVKYFILSRSRWLIFMNFLKNKLKNEVVRMIRFVIVYE